MQYKIGRLCTPKMTSGSPRWTKIHPILTSTVLNYIQKPLELEKFHQFLTCGTQSAHFYLNIFLNQKYIWQDSSYVKIYLKTQDTILLMGGIHIWGSMTKYLGEMKEKQATGEISIQDYVDLCRKCTRKSLTTKISKN